MMHADLTTECKKAKVVQKAHRLTVLPSFLPLTRWHGVMAKRDSLLIRPSTAPRILLCQHQSGTPRGNAEGETISRASTTGLGQLSHESFLFFYSARSSLNGPPCSKTSLLIPSARRAIRRGYPRRGYSLLTLTARMTRHRQLQQRHGMCIWGSYPSLGSRKGCLPTFDCRNMSPGPLVFWKRQC